jgi:hypothetical protein
MVAALDLRKTGHHISRKSPRDEFGRVTSFCDPI